MSKLIAFFSAHVQALRAAFRHAPVEAGLGFLVAVGFSVAVAVDESDTWEVWGRVAMASAVLLPVLLAMSYAAATGRMGRARWPASGAAVVAAAVYARFGLDPDDAVFTWRWGLLAAAAWSALLLAPVPARRAGDDPRAWFWTVNSRLASRITVVLLFTGALYLGLAGALAAIEALFDLDFQEDPYLHLFGAAFFGLVPSLVVGDLPEVLEPVGTEPARASRMVRWVGAYLIVPLLLTYVVILYAYNVKVLASGDLPRNVLSPLALGAAAFGLLGALLTDPLQSEASPAASVRLLRRFPLFFLPLLPLPGWAVLLRAQQHGWTEFRYVRMLALIGAATYCVLGIVRLVRRRPAPIAAIPAVFAAIFVVAAVGGPLSASAVGVASQTRRLLEHLDEAGLLADDGTLDRSARCPADPNADQWAPERELPAGTSRSDESVAPEGSVPSPGDVPTACQQIYGSAEYLVDRWGDERVRVLLGIDTDEASLDALTVLREAGVQPWYGGATVDVDTYVVQASLQVGDVVPGVPGGAHRRVQVWADDMGVASQMADVRATIDVAGARLRFLTTATDELCSFDLAPLVARVVEVHARGGAQPYATLTLDPDHVLLSGTESAGAPCGALLVEAVGLEVDADGPDYEIQHLDVRWIR